GAGGRRSPGAGPAPGDGSRRLRPRWYFQTIGKKCGVDSLVALLHKFFRGTTGLGKGGPAASEATRRDVDGDPGGRGSGGSREHGQGVERCRAPALLPD